MVLYGFMGQKIIHNIGTQRKEKKLLRTKQVRNKLVAGKEKIWSLAYADDMILLMNDAKEMRKMLKIFTDFLRREI